MKQVTSILIGAGLRGGYVYSQYALDHPDEFKVVAVAEPDQERRELFAAKHNIPKELQYESYEELLQQDKIADCAMICTQDKMHYEPVTMALQKGYHVLCEKPMSPNKDEIVKMGAMAKKYNRILSVCHVLRYSPFFSKIKEILDEERIGRMMSIQHIEEVGYWHHAHSFVRGNWRDKCPFYAPRFYLEHPKAVEDGLVYAVTDQADSEHVLKELKKGPYGRCVFHSDNTVVDHQTVDIEFENQVTASFLMTAFTNQCARRIRIMGTKGELKGDMEAGTIEIIDFVSGTNDLIQLHTPSKGHSGSDMSMMREFVRMVGEGKTGKTDASVSVASHLMALAAEEARIRKTVIDFEEYSAYETK